MATRDDFFREYVNPFFKTRGFIRKGRTYRRTETDGDAAVVHFQASTGCGAGEYLFYINLSVSPEPWSAYVNESQARRGQPAFAEPHVMNGLYCRRVNPPNGFQWKVTDEQGAEAAWHVLEPELSTALAQAVLLLDRATFVAYVEAGGRDVYRGPAVTRAMLRAASADADEMAELLAAVQGPSRADFIAWIGRYRAERGLPASG
jgi:hypothetical protein